MAVAGKVSYEVTKNTASLVTEDDFHRSDSDIHPHSEDNWEVCDARNGNVRRVATQISL
jgi:uridine kinase